MPLWLSALSTLFYFASATVALRLAALAVLRYAPGWRRCFALSVAATFLGIAAFLLVHFLIGDFAPGGWLELLSGFLAVAALYARFLRPPANAADDASPPRPKIAPWRFFILTVLHFVLLRLIGEIAGFAAKMGAP